MLLLLESQILLIAQAFARAQQIQVHKLLLLLLEMSSRKEIAVKHALVVGLENHKKITPGIRELVRKL